MNKPEDFSKFYYTKIGMGEACGCAERVIDVYEFNRKSGASSSDPQSVKQPRRSFASTLRRYGILAKR